MSRAQIAILSQVSILPLRAKGLLLRPPISHTDGAIDEMYSAREEKERKFARSFLTTTGGFNCSKEVDQKASSEWLDPTADPRDASQPKERTARCSVW